MQKTPGVTQGLKNGEGGIRTLGPVSRTQHFQCCTIGHSATSPSVHRCLNTREACIRIDLALCGLSSRFFFCTTLHNGRFASFQSRDGVQATLELPMVGVEVPPCCIPAFGLARHTLLFQLRFPRRQLLL